MNISFTVLDIGKLTDWLTLAVNVLAFTSGLILLWLTRKNVLTLLQQIRSQSDHQIIEAHKTLFMPLVEDERLARLVFGRSSRIARVNMLASMMINHASRIHAEYASKVRSRQSLDAFRRDLLDLFSIEIVRDRWPQVKDFHKGEFVHFVDESLGSLTLESGQVPASSLSEQEKKRAPLCK